MENRIRKFDDTTSTVKPGPASIGVWGDSAGRLKFSSRIAGVDTTIVAGDSRSNTSAVASYAKTTSGAQTLLAAQPFARNVIVQVTVTEVFANGDGAQPTFSIGYTGQAAAFAPTSKFTGAAVNADFAFGGTLPADTALLVTGVAASGTTSTGAIRATALTSQ